MRVAVIALLFVGSLSAAEEKEPPKLTPEVQAVVNLALAAPPEFAANAILRLIGEGKVIHRGAQRELLETAFQLGGRAQHPIRLVALQGSVDTRAGYRANALRVKLDAVSLQARAIQLVTPLDKAAARDWYRAFRRPQAERQSCSSALIPDFTAYYDMLTGLAQGVFTAADGDKDSRVAFVQTAVDGIASHSEVAPAARMLASIDWTASQFEIVTGAYFSKLTQLNADDRTFAFSAGDIETSIAALIHRARQYNTRPERIAESYRAYLVSNLSAPRCGDNGPTRVQATGGDGPVELFSATVRGELAPLTPEEIRPRSRKTEGEPKFEHYWQSSEAKQIFELCLKLRTGADGNYLPEAARNTREWKRQLGDFLTQIALWQPAHENSEEDFYHQKAIVYEALIELTPPGDIRGRVLGDYMAFLKTANLQQQNPVEWYWHVRSTLNRVRPTQPAEAQRLLDAFAVSGNVMLALEAMLERIAPNFSMFPD